MGIGTRRVVATMLAGVLSAGAPLSAFAQMSLAAQAESASELEWVRLEGQDRYGTMQAISERAFSSSEWAVIASGADFPDALAASALAGALDCPVLITQRDQLSSEVSDELERLGVTKAFVVGGRASVSDAVMDEIDLAGIEVARLAGSTRQKTSLVVAQKIVELRKDGVSDKRSNTLIVATGRSFADALSVSPYAYATASPILLTGDDGELTDEMVEALEDDLSFDEVVLVGGDSSVADEVEDQVGADATRLGGSDRYETSCLVADWELEHGLTCDTPVVAAGKNYPDALCGAALAGSTGSVMLLVDDTTNSTWAYLDEHAQDAYFGYVLGGVSSTPLDQGTAPVEDVASDERLNEILDTMVAEVTGEGEEGLRAAYEYISGFDYVTGNTYPEGSWLDWSVPYAIEMYENRGGNCYRFASLMAWCARRLGYDASVVSGKTYSSAGELVAHGWCEVHVGDATYVIDCERHRFAPALDFFMVTYEEAVMYYFNLADEQYV